MIKRVQAHQGEISSSTLNRVSLTNTPATTAANAATAAKHRNTEPSPQTPISAPTTLGATNDAIRAQQALDVMPIALARVG